MASLLSSEVLAQVPNSSRAGSTSRTPSTVSASKQSSSSQANRQIRKGDIQLSRANSSYQKAQQTPSGPTTNATRPTTTNSPAARTNTTRPSNSNSASRTNIGTTKQPTTSSSAARTNTTTRPVNANANSTSRTNVESTKQPATSSSAARTNINSSANTAKTNTQPVATNKEIANASRTNVATSTEGTAKRGYTEQGQPKPQPIATGPRNENPNVDADDRHPGGSGHGQHHGTPHTPYVHPNHHNYNGHMHIPPRIRPVYYHGIPYYFYNSVFCRYINGYYVICRPPLGAVIAYAIFNTWKPVIVVHKNVNYYYDDGTFYLPYNNNYQVVAPPIGARVAELPSNYEEIILDNTLYYKVDNVYYKAVVVSGYIWYEVVFVS